MNTRNNYGSTTSKAETMTILEDSSRLTHENEELASNVMGSMSRQRAQLKEIDGNLGAMTSLSSSASVTLRSMQDKAFSKKMWLYFIMILLLVVNLFLIIRMFRNHGSLY
mmetsp:Transcript_8504/g.12692  ORF Transcript_8504/g.12692 Transcript_8504/m.12692 type:complete len:110 (+) Transcript_8504:126-455(+)